MTNKLIDSIVKDILALPILTGAGLRKVLASHLSISKEEEPTVKSKEQEWRKHAQKLYKSISQEEVEESVGYLMSNKIPGGIGSYKPTPEQQSDKPTKIDMDELTQLLYSGRDLEGNSWSADIPKAIKMIADTINTQQEQIDYLTTQAKGNQS